MPGMADTHLVRPAAEHLPRYVAALERGWSPDNLRGAAAAAEELRQITADPDAFLARFDDEHAAAGPVPMPDGTTRPRLPSIRRWIWADDFCGSIGLRWTADGGPLPEHVPGHLGYAVVPWRQREGHATRALGLMLAEARARGLRRVEITTDPGNLASQKVVLANGGRLLGPYERAAALGDGPGLKFVIDLDGGGG